MIVFCHSYFQWRNKKKVGFSRHGGEGLSCNILWKFTYINPWCYRHFHQILPIILVHNHLTKVNIYLFWPILVLSFWNVLSACLPSDLHTEKWAFDDVRSGRGMIGKGWVIKFRAPGWDGCPSKGDLSALFFPVFHVRINKNTAVCEQEGHHQQTLLAHNFQNTHSLVLP